jgi:hypothetical protein
MRADKWCETAACFSRCAGDVARIMQLFGTLPCEDYARRRAVEVDAHG